MALLSGIASAIGTGYGIYESFRNRSSQRKQFSQQMDQSIQRRVADAKKAGVHPLFALGASVGASPTTTAGTPGANAISQGIDSIGKAVHSKKQRDLIEAQISSEAAKSQKDIAEAQLADARAAQIRGDFDSQGRDKGVTQDGVEDTPLGQVNMVSPDQERTQPGRSNVVAGVHPTLKLHTVLERDGKKYGAYLLNADNVSEATEGIVGSLLALPQFAGVGAEVLYDEVKKWVQKKWKRKPRKKTRMKRPGYLKGRRY